MVRNNNGPDYLQYSPFLFGCIFTFLIYLGMVLIVKPGGVSVPTWLWFLGLLVLITGGILQFLSKRVLWIRSYQAFVALLTAIINASLVWVMLAHNQNDLNRLLTGLSVSLIVIGGVTSIYLKNINNPYLVKMPHGPTGSLNPNTGIVTLTRQTQSIKESQTKNVSQLNIVLRFLPLAAGVAMFLIRVFPEQGTIAMASLSAMIWTILGATGAGGFMAYIFSILHWEQEHEKRIYIR